MARSRTMVQLPDDLTTKIDEIRSTSEVPMERTWLVVKLLREALTQRELNQEARRAEAARKAR